MWQPRWVATQLVWFPWQVMIKEVFKLLSRMEKDEFSQAWVPFPQTIHTVKGTFGAKGRNVTSVHVSNENRMFILSMWEPFFFLNWCFGKNKHLGNVIWCLRKNNILDSHRNRGCKRHHLKFVLELLKRIQPQEKATRTWLSHNVALVKDRDRLGSTDLTADISNSSHLQI